MSAHPPITLCIVNFQGERHLPSAFAAARDCGTAFAEVLVVDDASTDGGVAWLREHHPDARRLVLDRNRGPAAARNAGFAAAAHDLILFHDNDVQLQPGCVAILLEALSRSQGALLVAPRVVLASDPEHVQFDSADCHFLGLMTTRNAGRDLQEAPEEIATTTSLVTACFLVDRRRWPGGAPFDEWFGFNYEDHDFGVRANVLGCELLIAPAARVLHGTGTQDLSYRPGGAVPGRRVFYLLRNRWAILTRAYAARTLLLLAPALLCFELFQFAGAARKGWAPHWHDALRSWRSELPRLRRERRELQRARRRPDRAILRGGPLPLTDAVSGGRIERAAIGAMQAIAGTWWRLVRLML